LGDEAVNLELDGFDDEVHASRDTDGIVVRQEMTGKLNLEKPLRCGLQGGDGPKTAEVGCTGMLETSLSITRTTGNFKLKRQ
jgi:hypothetical protein